MVSAYTFIYNDLPINSLDDNLNLNTPTDEGSMELIERTLLFLKGSASTRQVARTLGWSVTDTAKTLRQSARSGSIRPVGGRRADARWELVIGRSRRSS